MQTASLLGIAVFFISIGILF